MPFRFRKSFKLGPGVKFNIGKRSASISIGGRGHTLTTGTEGTTASGSVPGTGIGFRQKLGRKNGRPGEASRKGKRHGNARASRSMDGRHGGSPVAEQPSPLAFVGGLLVLGALGWGVVWLFQSLRAPLPASGQSVLTPTSPAAQPAAQVGKSPTEATAPKLPTPPGESMTRKYTAKLNQARYFIKSKAYKVAGEYLRQIITEIPGTEVGKEAQKELDSLPPE